MPRAIESKAIWSHKSDEWATPQAVYEALDSEFHFTLDPCATEANAKCGFFFTKEDDGLQKNWGGWRVFCNPPYSNIKDWAKKCYEESTHALIVMLVPSRTDTAWFHDYVYGKAEIRFIKGRLKFGNAEQNAPFPSMIAIYREQSDRDSKQNRIK